MPNQSTTGMRDVPTESRNGAKVVRRWGIAFLIAAMAFYRPLRELVRFATHTELYSHILLIPAICFYLIWTNRRMFPVGKSSMAGALLGYIPAFALVGWYLANPAAQVWKVEDNYLCAMAVSLVFVCIGNLFL